MINVSKLRIASPRFQSRSWQAFLVAGLMIAAVTAVRVVLDSWIAGMPFVLFFPAVIVVTFLCGSTAGLLAASLSILAAWLFVIPVSVSSVPILQTALFTVGCVAVVTAIGAMRIATADVRISESRFRGLLESAPDAMVILDGHRRIALINARTEELFGYRRGELLGQPIDLLLPERHRGKYREQLGALLGGSSACKGGVIDLEGVRKAGNEFPIEVSIGPIETEAGALVSNAIRDITARRAIEASLVEASKAKSDFLANVSHELRTPLNAIIGFSELIRDAVMGPLDNRYREYGKDINESGRHLQNIINDILDISKIEHGRLELRDDVVSIGETVEACRRIVAPMADAAGVSLSIELPGALPLIHSDQVRFQQILLNLLSNAVKFTPAGGCVTVSAAVEGGGAVIAVTDTGIGMKAEDIALALEPFRQIDGALSRRYTGTGLGLPLAKGLVELHGGRLDIASAPGAGTTVRVRLPRERMLDAAA